MQASSADTHYMAEGDNLPYAESVLRDGSGSPIPLTALDSVIFKMQLYPAPIGDVVPSLGGDAAVVAPGAALIDPDCGRVRYIWQSTDVVAGSYQCQWKVTFQDGTVAHFPNASFDLVLISPAIPDP